jgi:hypothetical protein
MLTQVDAVALRRCHGRDHGDAAGIEGDDVVGELEGQLRAPLDQHDGQAAFLEFADGRHDFGDDLRGEPVLRSFTSRRAELTSARDRWPAFAAHRQKGRRGTGRGAGTRQKRWLLQTAHVTIFTISSQRRQP